MTEIVEVDFKQKDRTMINIVWFKRDLRLSDHAPITQAFSSGLPTLMIYNFEPQLRSDPHYSDRHWQFVWQSITDINQQLKRYGGKVYHFSEPMIQLLKRLALKYQFTLYSHQEIGLSNTFDRDREIADWCRAECIPWHEYPSGAVIRGLSNRENWESHWKETMTIAPEIPNWGRYQPLELEQYTEPELPDSYQLPNTLFQKGGPTQARETLRSFLSGRGLGYRRSVSSPSESRVHCSRLSPYLAWGNLSLRQVYQYTQQHIFNSGGFHSSWHKPLGAFKSRLHWHCHFIQKFESQCIMEHEPLNPGYKDYPYRTDSQVNEDVQRWAAGNTGIPLVDASMRCLKQTGYINFRMRAMLVSFVTHHLNIDWRLASIPLAQYFLDFEPGIHYPQVQMQASVTGINTVRIYNPIKQSIDRDAKGVFIKQWCPELNHLDEEQIHEPWQHSASNVPNKNQYPEPMIDLKKAAKEARDRLWTFRKRDEVQNAIPEILRRHISPK